MAHTEIPKFLISKRYISLVILCVVLFSGLFLFLYKDYALSLWFGTSDTARFSLTILFYVAAILLLILSRTIMYILQDRLDLTRGVYLWWIIAENILISMLYTVMTIYLFPRSGIKVPDIAIRAFLCVTVILAIPNGIIAIIAAYRTKCEELIATQYQLQRLGEEYRILQNSTESELRAAATLTSAVSASTQERATRMVQLHDNSGTLRLTINLDALYYMESEDNYIRIYYKHNDRIASYMLRCRTSSLEKSLEGTSMARCHRSYIVNINKINFMGEERRMHYISLDDDSIKRIPVSKSYYESLLQRLNNKC